MSVGGEFGRRVSDDELCADVRRAVESGDEDALRRLGFGGFGGYVQRLSEIMSDSVTDGLDLSADDFGAIMGEVASPARYAHHLVNEAGTAIQSAKDKPLGIRIKPAEPDFDDDALCGTVGKASSMDTPEQTVATLADGLGYAVKKAGNDFIKANAEQRSRAGFEVGVKRSGDSKCCPWCAARIGSWAIANAPDDVFGCHANCSCTVEYTSSTGAKTSARGANLHHYGAGAFVEVDYQPPHVMSSEEAREKGGFDEPKRLTKNPVESQPHRLTGAANGGIIEHEDISHKSSYIVPNGLLESDEYKAKFKHMTDNEDLQKQFYNAACEILSHRSGTNGEDLYYYNPRLDKWYKSKEGTRACEPKYNAEIYLGLSESKKNEIVAFHNHAGSTPPSIDDINTAQQNNYNRGYILCHDGRIFEYGGSNVKVSRAEFAEYAIWFRDKKNLSDIEARIQAIELLSPIYDFNFRELV